MAFRNELRIVAKPTLPRRLQRDPPIAEALEKMSRPHRLRALHQGHRQERPEARGALIEMSIPLQAEEFGVVAAWGKVSLRRSIGMVFRVVRYL